MMEYSPFDYVWLGLLIGVFDVGDSEEGMRQLLNHLDDMGLAATRSRLLDEESNKTFESDDIARWVDEELTEHRLKRSFGSKASSRDFTDLINSFAPGIWLYLPQSLQNDLGEARQNITLGHLKSAVLLLGFCSEAMLRHFHEKLLPESNRALDWSQMERELYALNDRDLVPALHIIKDVRLNYRNSGVHENKEYDEFSAREQWNQTVLAVTRMARILENRFPLFGEPNNGSTE